VPVAADPLLWRVTDRNSFAALRASRAVGRSGPLTVRWVAPAGDGPARAAFSVSTRAGGAVLRNRVRRRLRAGLRHLAVTGELPRGTYLVSARGEAATVAWADLLDHLGRAVTEAAS
jgi:ribonuclease P protein component